MTEIKVTCQKLASRISEKLELSADEQYQLFSAASQGIDRDSGGRGLDQIKVSYVLGILIAVYICFSDPKRAVQHLRRPNSDFPFDGRSPLDLMMTGTEGLRLTRKYFDEKAQPLGKDDPVYKWALNSILSD
ncbi:MULTISPECIES: MbcA/ParS/Xre antitoxin family protein [Marinobacter]|uniref:MbcA/ParS/Xre antitoxin family protein n=1 Tax=Marinobacter TaxID=2742 RepID=UPI000ACA968B|nr:MbcA/ParS/Xre antitoxin family protein [Marinobacter sp.]MBO6812357.1 DUF2384 domain-containing protein [Marinobacter sp.]MBO6873266.1 DUF2384 domain-containing protein [Marinobacter sp.]